ncbi:MAG: YidC/Oxa1 family membrane protein insertase [Terrisporobacter sp.]|uniref:YidC/Oxa1 family membrane protein insertase n=1 Tax=Terrisporobacter sp. TaxID=1965305 RepID=UPI002FCB3995
MSIISNALGHILRIIFEFVNNYGWSIVVFTLFVRLLLLPLMVKQIKSQKSMQDIQPKIKEIQEKYKNKPEKQQEELMKIYKEAKINPLAGCLPLLIQMPILIGLFNVLREPVTYGVFANAELASQASQAGFLWIKDISATGSISLALISGVSAYFMQKMMTTGDEQTENMMKSMTYVMAAMSLYWGYSFPAGLAIYWITSNMFSIAQYQLITSPLKAKLADSKEEIVKNEKSGKSNKKFTNKK